MAEATNEDVVMDSQIPETQEPSQLQTVQEGPGAESQAINIADHEEGAAVEPATTKKKARERKDHTVTRDKGRSIFPIARVQKIMKADKVCDHNHNHIGVV